jgi:hypothetical protein
MENSEVKGISAPEPVGIFNTYTAENLSLMLDSEIPVRLLKTSGETASLNNIKGLPSALGHSQMVPFEVREVKRNAEVVEYIIVMTNPFIKTNKRLQPKGPNQELRSLFVSHGATFKAISEQTGLGVATIHEVMKSGDKRHNSLILHGFQLWCAECRERGGLPPRGKRTTTPKISKELSTPVPVVVPPKPTTPTFSIKEAYQKIGPGILKELFDRPQPDIELIKVTLKHMGVLAWEDSDE